MYRIVPRPPLEKWSMERFTHWTRFCKLNHFQEKKASGDWGSPRCLEWRESYASHPRGTPKMQRRSDPLQLLHPWASPQEEKQVQDINFRKLSDSINFPVALFFDWNWCKPCIKIKNRKQQADRRGKESQWVEDTSQWEKNYIFGTSNFYYWFQSKSSGSWASFWLRRFGFLTALWQSFDILWQSSNILWQASDKWAWNGVYR